jgi:hypothetical protein
MSSITPGAVNALTALLEILARSEVPATVRIRLHPSDDPHRYDAIIARYRSTGAISIVLSKGREIVSDLLSASMVVGEETVALAVSARCGIPTACILEPKARSSMPKQILRIKNDNRLRSRLAAFLSEQGLI